MIVYRIGSEQFVYRLDGGGAKLVGGRWNSVGKAIIYTSASLSTSILEKLANTDYANLPDDNILVSLNISDDASILYLHPEDLPDAWNELPHNEDTQLIGDKFITDNEALILCVPSALAPTDYNMLINPNHPEFEQKVTLLKGVAFNFDTRLLE